MTQDDGMTIHRPSCRAKHTKYQPGTPGAGPWECPKCGADSDKGFIIDEPAEDAEEHCDRLHLHDMCVCENCGLQGQGSGIARKLAKKHNVVACPHCKGTGVVKA